MRICNNCGSSVREGLTYCEKCGAIPEKEYPHAENNEEVVDTSQSDAKKNRRTIYILISVAIAFIIVMIGYFFVKINDVKTGTARRYLEDIEYSYHSGDFDEALKNIEYFNKSLSGDSEKITGQVKEIYDDIEEDLYNSASNGDVDACKIYFQYYPSGKHIAEVKAAYAKVETEKTVENVSFAKQAIANGNILEADELLVSVIESEYATAETIEEAKSISNSIAEQVVIEKGKTEILGPWKKATGVCYIFEEGGHMSVSLYSNYDSSKGTTGDGLEVKSLLGEIDDFGRVVRGGTWNYVGEYEGHHCYRLFYQSSLYNCMIVDGKLYIQLSSGLGSMSGLTRVTVYNS